ncbi:laminin subunit alpha-3-like [Gigantopelta aegis]|uniref:laminin subunit alpha-3-like n=1 Tax=Gigantopelta aegis TaxID=1735272 RepID=UPI001B8873BF|nr:laminin subunit alpha-3-like [Gigantopelta aegis]
MTIKIEFPLLLGDKDVVRVRRWSFVRSTRWMLVSCVVLLVLTYGCEAQYQICEEVGGSYSACTPTPMTITRTTNVTTTVEPTNKTCGLSGAEYYFRLGKKTRALKCDASSTQYKHPPEYMLDGTTDDTWWQSITWTIPEYTNDRTAFPINITLSFNKIFRMTENLTITFDSGRPQKMFLQKSLDYGQTWTDIQYYARDCSEFPGIPTKYTTETPTTVICSEAFSQDRSTPRPGGKVFFPGSTERLKETATREKYYELLETTHLEEFMSFTDIRIVLLYPATDSREKFTRKNPMDFYQYYYAISNIELIASCFCNQHAGVCLENDQRQFHCQCSHNTAGRDCEKCLPLFNNRPWRQGSFIPYHRGQANECIKCQCNDHADSCTYNATYGRGVCDSCTNNTTGYHCELCLETFYRNTSLPLSDPEICISCDCEPQGITDDGKCQQEVGNSLKPLGQCNCKPNATSRRCDACFDGFYGLVANGNCSACKCNVDGTTGKSNVCRQTDGQCPCKTSTTGKHCDTCKDGYYLFPTGRPDAECTACGCDPGGSKTAVCENRYGTCTCRDHVAGPKCHRVEENFYIPALDKLLLQPDTGSCPVSADLWMAGQPFDGNVFAVCPPAATSAVDFQFTDGRNQQLYVIWPHYVGVRYSLSGTTQRVINQLEVTVVGNSGADLTGLVDDNGQSVGSTCPETTLSAVSTIPVVFQPGLSTGIVSGKAIVNLDRRCRYKFRLSLQGQPGDTESIRIDSIVLIPALSYDVMGKSFAEYKQAGDTSLLTEKYITCIRKMSSLLMRDEALQQEPCGSLLKSVAAELYNGGRACNCDSVGSLPDTKCQMHGGQCQCKPGVAGRRCDVCHPGYFNFTSSGCQPCSCDAGGSKNGDCNKQTGQCDCRQNVAMFGQNNTNGMLNDRHCTACVSNFYGFGNTDGCVLCNCDQTGSTSPQCANDGQCPCKETIDGRRCDKCKPSFFFFSANGCQSCNCSTAGSESVECDQIQGICKCKSSVRNGGKCDQCKDGFYNLADYNPRGCQPCFCFGHGDSCKSAEGFSETTVSVSTTDGWGSENEFIVAPAEFLGDHHSSYGQLLTFQLAKAGADIKLENQVLVTIEGHALKLLHYGDQSANGTGDVSINVRLFPELWIIESKGKKPTSDEMYRILAGMEKLTFRKSVAGKPLIVSMVSMVTAQLGDKNPTTFVEDCMCKPAEFVSGTSCQNCTGGYQRYNQSTLTPYDICVSCSCNERSTECDENSGVCLSCRNGTTGKHCENCSANVISPQCNECVDRFFGMGIDGCRACNCSEIGSLNLVCNKSTGQCLCASHVTGRVCDVCEDNYHSLTKNTGCTVCSGCYDLVGEEVVKLRLLQENLTNVVTALEASDNTASLDSFPVRLATANIAMNKLLEFLRTAEASEETNRGKLSAFNSTIKYLSSAVGLVETEKKASISALLNEARNNIQKAVDAKKQITTHMIKINSLIAPLEVIAASLNSLMTSLKEVEAYLQNISDSASTDLTGVLNTVSLIENTAAEAGRLAESLLQVVQSMLVKHDKNGRDITALQGTAVTLKSLGVTTNDEANRVFLKSSNALEAATRLQNISQSLGTSSVDFVNLNTQLNGLKSRADTANTQATNGTTELQNQQQTILQASSLAEQQRMNTVNMVQSGDGLEERAVNASRKATDAQRNSDDVFTSAQNMLNTMRNFSTKAAEVETKANTALQSVQALDALSQQVISDSNTLISSLTTTQQSASLAKEIARQAKAVAQQQNDGMKTVWNESQASVASLDQDFVNITAKNGRPQEVTNTIVMPAQALCDSYGMGIDEATAKTRLASAAVANATSSVNSINTKASNILNELRNLGNIDTARISALQQEVAAAQTLFDSQALAAAITVIKNEFDLQSQWLLTARQKKTNTGQEIIRLKAVQVSIIP